MAQAVVAAKLTTGRAGSLMRGERTWGYLFILPWALGFLLFTAGPMIASLVISVMKYDIVQPMEYVGLDHYQRLIKDGLITKSLYNTAYYTLIGVPLHNIASLGAAFLLTREIPAKNFFRTAFYIPSIVPTVANVMLWMWLLNPDWGLANAALTAVGLPRQLFLYSIKQAKASLIAMSLWQLGSQMVVYIAGIENIPRSLYEAAEIDGANRFQLFQHILIPMLTPVIFFNVVVGFIGSFQVFQVAYIASNGAGGPSQSTMFYVLYLYRTAWIYFQMGYASAMAWVLFLIIVALTGVQFWLSKRWVHYE